MSFPGRSENKKCVAVPTFGVRHTHAQFEYSEKCAHLIFGGHVSPNRCRRHTALTQVSLGVFGGSYAFAFLKSL